MTMLIHLENEHYFSDVPDIEQFHQWLTAVIENLPEPNHLKKKELNIFLVTPEESANLNASYRHKEGPTNILSFPDEDIPGFSSTSLGDLVICVPLVSKEAEEQELSTEAHWAHLFIHGVLHLLEYDHEKNEDAVVMEALEVTILKKLGYANPYEATELL